MTLGTVIALIKALGGGGGGGGGGGVTVVNSNNGVLDMKAGAILAAVESGGVVIKWTGTDDHYSLYSLTFADFTSDGYVFGYIDGSSVVWYTATTADDYPEVYSDDDDDPVA